jgi:hypothetical protein
MIEYSQSSIHFIYLLCLSLAVIFIIVLSLFARSFLFGKLSRHHPYWFFLFLFKPTLKSSSMPCIKFLTSKPFSRKSMWTYWRIAIEVHKVSFYWNSPIFSLYISTTRHTLTDKLRSASMAPNVLLEFAVVSYLNSQRIFFNISVTNLTYSLWRFSGLYQNFVVTHRNLL